MSGKGERKRWRKGEWRKKKIFFFKRKQNSDFQPPQSLPPRGNHRKWVCRTWDSYNEKGTLIPHTQRQVKPCRGFGKGKQEVIYQPYLEKGWVLQVVTSEGKVEFGLKNRLSSTPEAEGVNSTHIVKNSVNHFFLNLNLSFYCYVFAYIISLSLLSMNKHTSFSHGI